MAEKLPLHWVCVAVSVAEIQFNEKNIAEVDADGKIICMARYQDQLYAFAQKCPHASGYFINGYIDATGNIVCPLHRYRFSIRNGRNSSLEGYYLKHWPVEIREDGIYVGFSEKKPWSFLGI